MSLSETRSRRSNAGSRMQTLILQQQTDSLFDEDALDDVEDYVVEEQQDVFDDDFGSTDDEADAVDEEAQVQLEERNNRQRTRKAITSLTAPVPKRQLVRNVKPTVKVREGSEALSSPRSGTPTSKRRSNKETLDSSLFASVRQSNRSATIASKRMLEQRLIKDQKRKALHPYRPRQAEEELTQEMKLEEAKETERINLASLQNLLQNEEANKKKRQQRTAERVGPIIRFRSCKEGLIEYITEDITVDDAELSPERIREANGRASQARISQDTNEPFARNLLIFEGFTEDPFEEWANQVPYPVKPNCSFTGLPARYIDPRTQVPYATKEAYAILQGVVQNQFAWSPVLRTYIHSFDAPVPPGLPNRWFESTFGVAIEKEEKPPKPKRPLPSPLDSTPPGHIAQHSMFGIIPNPSAPNGVVRKPHPLPSRVENPVSRPWTNHNGPPMRPLPTAIPPQIPIVPVVNTSQQQPPTTYPLNPPVKESI
ncbi:YL1 nuclear protein-domain-containing protein [Phlyctochytrium arcticum]|nr:YL1 nuclear protein-domain-containing protein [Phlyctochytrium arcticum]